uniref:Protein quiver n=1 Tax=Strongyloides venezuelensis TaxID=75913 RepID=A0A0K0FLW8_STRVS
MDILCTKNHSFKCFVLPAHISKEAQLSLKYILYKNFNIPPVNILCSYEENENFKYLIPIDTCNDNDECVKVVSKSENLQFTMRGCRKKLFLKKSGNKEISRKYIQERTCQASINPIVCGCSGDRCNSKNIIA